MRDPFVASVKANALDSRFWKSAMSLKSTLHDPLDASDPSDSFSSGSAFQLLLQQGQSGAPPTPVVLPAETYEAQAAVSASGPGGPGSWSPKPPVG